MSTIYTLNGQQVYDYNGQTFNAKTGTVISGTPTLSQADIGIKTSPTVQQTLNQTPTPISPANTSPTVPTPTPTPTPAPNYNATTTSIDSTAGLTNIDK